MPGLVSSSTSTTGLFFRRILADFFFDEDVREEDLLFLPFELLLGFDETDFERDNFVEDFDIVQNRKTIVTNAKTISHIS